MVIVTMMEVMMVTVNVKVLVKKDDDVAVMVATSALYNRDRSSYSYLLSNSLHTAIHLCHCSIGAVECHATAIGIHKPLPFQICIT